MKRIAMVALACAVSFSAAAQSREDLEKFKQQQQAGMQQTADQFKQFADQRLEEYQNYEKQLKAEYEAFKKEVMEKWGDRTMIESSKKKWVEYGDDKSSRTTVDFENGKVTVEVLADPTDDDKTIQKKLENAVGDLMNSKGKTVDFDSKVIPTKPLSEEPILKDQIDFSKYASLNLKRKDSGNKSQGGGSLADRNQKQNNDKQEKKQEQQLRKEQQEQAPKVVVKEEKPVTTPVRTVDGEKKIVKIEMNLVEDHIPKRAEKFKSIIKTHSNKFSVDEPLIYAIMEQESAFNPAAKSYVPAYGLMQLVPKSGGRDAYNYVHKQDKIPTADFLYNPENNIQLGTGYLQLLMTRYFAGVTDPQCRILCAIAAYNTGAGNVSRAFTGNTNIKKAIPHINKLTYDQLYNHLRSKLPHAETRDYVKNVTSKMEKYKK